jgi:hypothetical protein
VLLECNALQGANGCAQVVYCVSLKQRRCAHKLQLFGSICALLQVLRTGASVIVLGEIGVAELSGKEMLVIRSSTPKVSINTYCAVVNLSATCDVYRVY